MITDKQVKKLMKLIKTEKNQNLASAKAGMDEQTARKYIRTGNLPSQSKVEHTWKTRVDPFEEIWDEIFGLLETNAHLESTTLFFYIQNKYPGKYSDGQLRTLQRKIKSWCALKGLSKEVYFPQKHHPGKLAESDFTNMSKLLITINSRSSVYCKP